MGHGGIQVAGRTSEWLATWSEIMGVGGLDPSAANRGAYARLVDGIASRPKPKTPSKPAAGGPPQPHPPNPGTPSPRAWRKSIPPSTRKARYDACILALI